MAIVIKETVGIYIANPKDILHTHGNKANNLKKFLASIKQPYTVKNLVVPNVYRIKLTDITPLTKTFNVIIIPSNTFFFNAFIHSSHVVIVVSLDSGYAKYSHGIYCQSLTLVRRYLAGLPVDIKKGSMYYRMKPEGKAIIVASMVDIKDFAYFSKIYLRLLKIKLDKKVKDAIIRILVLKKRKYMLYSNKESR
jgi:hypothetical protein